VWQRLPRCTGAPASARTFVVQMSAFDPLLPLADDCYRVTKGPSSINPISQSPRRHLGPEGNAQDSRWFNVQGESVKANLAFDHAEILRSALARLRSKVEYISLPAFLLPGEFTLTQLQRTYEIILGRPSEKKAFRIRVLSAGIVEELPRKLGAKQAGAALQTEATSAGAHFLEAIWLSRRITLRQHSSPRLSIHKSTRPSRSLCAGPRSRSRFAFSALSAPVLQRCAIVRWTHRTRSARSHQQP